MNWDFWLDKPLHVVVILVGGFILNLVLRSVIRRVMDRIAEGAPVSKTKKEPSPFAPYKRKISEESEQAQARRIQRAQTVGSVLRSITTIVLVVIVALMVLSEFGFNLAPVLASAGIVGVALGFGAQTLVKDFLAGLFIVLEDQYGIGDVVDFTDMSGVVENVGLRATHVRGTDGTLWHISNGEILKVGNMSQGWSRTVMDIPIPYTADIDTSSELILNTACRLREEPEFGPDILDTPEIWGVQDLTGEAITLRLVLRTRPLKQWGIGRVLRARLKTAFDAADLKIPLNQQVVIHTNPKAPSDVPTSTGVDAASSHGLPSTGPWTHGGPSNPIYEIPEG